MKWGLTKRDENRQNSLDSIRKDFDAIFDDFFSLKPSALFESDWVPSVDVEEDDKAIHVKAEVPGLEEKDLDVSLHNNMLTIKGEKKEEKKEEKGKNRIISERRYGSFSRSISLPEGIKTDKVKAKFKNGILNIEIPKDESVKPKKISIDVH